MLSNKWYPYANETEYNKHKSGAVKVIRGPKTKPDTKFYAKECVKDRNRLKYTDPEQYIKLMLLSKYAPKKTPITEAQKELE